MEPIVPFLNRLLLQRRIDAGQQLTLLHLLIEVGIDRGDLPRDLRTDLHGRDGTQCAGRGNRRLEIAAGYGREPVGRSLARIGSTVDRDATSGEHDYGCGRCAPTITTGFSLRTVRFMK